MQHGKICHTSLFCLLNSEKTKVHKILLLDTRARDNQGDLGQLIEYSLLLLFLVIVYSISNL